MIFDVTKPLPKSTVFEGKTYKINLSYSNVLKVFDIFKEQELTESERAKIALLLLVNKKAPFQLLEHIFDNYISINKKITKNTGIRTVDFRQDGAYLYSSFLYDYKINLVKARNKLHWWEFISLFQGLSENTKMREVMRIRGQKIPERTKYNGEYIENLLEMKSYYALEISQFEREQNFQKGLENLASLLKLRAK